MPSTKPLINFVMEPEMVERLDDFRYGNRFPSRAAAIKWLLTWALDQQPVVKREDADQGREEAAA